MQQEVKKYYVKVTVNRTIAQCRVAFSLKFFKNSPKLRMQIAEQLFKYFQTIYVSAVKDYYHSMEKERKDAERKRKRTNRMGLSSIPIQLECNNSPDGERLPEQPPSLNPNEERGEDS